MINFKTENQMLNFMTSELNFEPNISLIISKEYLDIILEGIDFDCKSYLKEINSDKYTYLIEKYEDDEQNIHIEVIPVEFDDDGILETEVDNEFVIVQEHVLDEDDIAQIYVDEKLTIVNYEYENEDNSNECCQGCYDDGLTEEEDLIEEYALLIENTDGCPCCIRRILSELIEDVKETNDNKNITINVENIEIPKFDFDDIGEFVNRFKEIANTSRFS